MDMIFPFFHDSQDSTISTTVLLHLFMVIFKHLQVLGKDSEKVVWFDTKKFAVISDTTSRFLHITKTIIFH